MRHSCGFGTQRIASLEKLAFVQRLSGASVQCPEEAQYDLTWPHQHQNLSQVSHPGHQYLFACSDRSMRLLKQWWMAQTRYLSCSRLCRAGAFQTTSAGNSYQCCCWPEAGNWNEDAVMGSQ